MGRGITDDGHFGHASDREWRYGPDDILGRFQCSFAHVDGWRSHLWRRVRCRHAPGRRDIDPDITRRNHTVMGRDLIDGRCFRDAPNLERRYWPDDRSRCFQFNFTNYDPWRFDLWKRPQHRRKTAGIHDFRGGRSDADRDRCSVGRAIMARDNWYGLCGSGSRTDSFGHDYRWDIFRRAHWRWIRNHEFEHGQRRFWNPGDSPGRHWPDDRTARPERPGRFDNLRLLPQRQRDECGHGRNFCGGCPDLEPEYDRDGRGPLHDPCDRQRRHWPDHKSRGLQCPYTNNYPRGYHLW